MSYSHSRSRSTPSPISPLVQGINTLDMRTPRQSPRGHQALSHTPSPVQAQLFPWPSPPRPSPHYPNTLAPPMPPMMHRRTPSLTSSVSSVHTADSRPVTPPSMAPPLPYPLKALRGYPCPEEYIDPATEEMLLRAPVQKPVALPSVEGDADVRVRAWLQAQGQSTPTTIPIHVEPPTPGPYQHASLAPAYYPPPPHRAPPPSPYRPY